MTNIEKQFFETFGIEAITKCVKPDIKRINPTFCEYYKNCTECDYYNYKYPSITDRVLLELVCIISPNSFFAKNTDALKIEILVKCLKREKDENIRKQIRALFREEK